MFHAYIERFDVMGGRGNILDWGEVNKALVDSAYNSYFLVFLVRIVFFSHHKSVSSVFSRLILSQQISQQCFQSAYQHNRTEPIFLFDFVSFLFC
jgi:hypothetical protein